MRLRDSWGGAAWWAMRAGSHFPCGVGHFPFVATTYLRLPRFFCPESAYSGHGNGNEGEVVATEGEVVVMGGKWCSRRCPDTGQNRPLP